MKKLSEFELYFSYNQFFVYDSGKLNCACDWTEEHYNQGFARRCGTVAIGTLYSFGQANLTLYLGAPLSLKEYERVIAVPLEIAGGSVSIDGVDEWPANRNFQVPNGSFKVVVAQRDAGSNPDREQYREDIHVFLEQLPEPMERSEILVKDPMLDPPEILIEDAEEPRV